MIANVYVVGILSSSMEINICSKPCHSKHRELNVPQLSSEEIKSRITTIMSSANHTVDIDMIESKNLHLSETFCYTFNRINSLSSDEMSKVVDDYDSSADNAITLKNNIKNIMLSYCIRIGAYQGICETLFDVVVAIQNYPKKTENIEFLTMIYGEEEAWRKIAVKSHRVVGDKNPAYQHNGKFSPFSEKFIKGDIREQTLKKANETRDKNNTYQSRLSYWTERFGEELGRELYHERQSTFSLNKLIEKYGEEEGTRRWKQRQKKWQASLNSLPESEKIRINAKKGFWKYTVPLTDEMEKEFNKIPTKLYVIEYHLDGIDDGRKYIKVGVTSKYLHQRFSSFKIKEEILIHQADRFTNYHIEKAVKQFIFDNNLSILLESEDDRFDGWTECVNIEHRDVILKVVYEAIRNNT